MEEKQRKLKRKKKRKAKKEDGGNRRKGIGNHEDDGSAVKRKNRRSRRRWELTEEDEGRVRALEKNTGEGEPLEIMEKIGKREEKRVAMKRENWE